MDELELPPIQITADDISKANRLSLQCPLCANPVENHVEAPELQPILCAQCKTLYHEACWEQGGGKCAVLGCGHDQFFVYGADTRPILKISHADLPRVFPNGAHLNKRLKTEQQRRVRQLREPGLMRRLWQWLLDAIRVG